MACSKRKHDEVEIVAATLGETGGTKAARKPKTQRTVADNKRTNLEHLPAEILEAIAWLSLTPDLGLVSKGILAKLGHTKDVRRDMVMIVFCQWEAVLKSKTPIDTDFASGISTTLDTTKLPLRSSIAKSACPLLDSPTRYALQQRYGELKWCSASLLKDVGNDICLAWANNHFLKDKLDPIGIEGLIRCQYDEPALIGYSVLTDSGAHEVTVNQAYHFDTMCLTSCPHDMQPVCPTVASAKFGTHSLFRLPRIPQHILDNDDDSSSKEAAIRFYQYYGLILPLYMVEENVREYRFEPRIRKAIFGAMNDDSHALLRVLLDEGVFQPTIVIGGQSAPWCTSMQDILAFLACKGKWRSLMALGGDLTKVEPQERSDEDHSWVERIDDSLGLEVLDDHAKALILSRALEDADMDNETNAWNILEWLAMAPECKIPESWLEFKRPSSKFGNEAQPRRVDAVTLEAINAYALKAANKNVFEETLRIKRQALTAVTAVKIPEAVEESMQCLRQRRQSLMHMEI